MTKNMGSMDRIIRVILAIVFAGLFYTGTASGVLGYVLLGLGGVFILTSLVGYCPLYSLFGFSTCPTKS